MPDWRFVLCATPNPTVAPAAQPLVPLGDLSNATSKANDIGLNRPGAARFSLSAYDDMAYEIFHGDPVRATLQRSIMVVRNKVILWSGFLTTMAGDFPNNGDMMNWTALGWFEQLNYRELHADLNFIGNNPATGKPWTDADIAYGLLSQANAQDPTWVSKGIASGPRVNRERVYKKGQKIGPAIHDLSQIENGYDYWVDPITRELHLSGAGSPYTQSAAHFGYKWGPNNLSRLSVQEDGTATRNRISANGPGGIGTDEDATSISVNGIFEETVNLAEVFDPVILVAFAGAEIAIKAYPQIVYNITPFPAGAARIPQIFDEYQIGQKVFFSAKVGAFQVDKQAARVFSASIEIDANGNEIISSLQISPNA
jgi:hypothetical protein